MEWDNYEIFLNILIKYYKNKEIIMEEIKKINNLCQISSKKYVQKTKDLYKNTKNYISKN
jgi:hypothetical protein